MVKDFCMPSTATVKNCQNRGHGEVKTGTWDLLSLGQENAWCY